LYVTIAIANVLVLWYIGTSNSISLITENGCWINDINSSFSCKHNNALSINYLSRINNYNNSNLGFYQKLKQKLTFDINDQSDI